MKEEVINKVMWDERYIIDNSNIDEQHKKIFSILDLLENSCNSESESESESESKTILFAIDSLFEYTQVHFHAEEQLMLSGNYNKYEEHKLLHEQFIDSILIYREQFELIGASEIAVMLCLKLREWLVNHILFVDQDYSHSLNLKPR
jgi:hemerythrin